jgi:hypothetical protein
MKDSFFSRSAIPAPLSSVANFQRYHRGPGDPTLVALFERTRDEMIALRAKHAAFVYETRRAMYEQAS